MKATVDTIPGMELVGIHQRRFGSALLVFGAVGAALAVGGALLLLVAVVSTASLDSHLEGSRVELVASLERAQVALRHAADTTDNVGGSLDSTRAVLADSSKTLATLGDASDALANGLGAVSLLGSQPFASAAGSFRSLAGQVRSYAEHAAQLTTDLQRNVGDMRTITSDLRDLESQLGLISTNLDALDAGAILTTLLWGLVLLLALTAWLAIGAIGCALAGYRVRVRASEPVPGGTPAIIVPGRDVTEAIDVARPAEGLPKRRSDERTR